MQKLDKDFFLDPAYVVAQKLIGKIFVHQMSEKTLMCKIVETEAYIGDFDRACHASKGRTKRTEALYEEGGRAYIYLCYGIYDLFNVVCSHAGDPQGVLIRAAEPLNFSEKLSGPGLFAKNMHLSRLHYNRESVCGNALYFLDHHESPSLVAAPRVGVDYAGKWADVPLRFFDPSSPFVSIKKF